MPNDKFDQFSDSPTAPARECFVVIPDDVVPFAKVTKALFIGQGGDVCLVPAAGSDSITFRNIPSGFILDVQVSAVLASGTTADAIVGLA